MLAGRGNGVYTRDGGAIAQLGERLLCKQEVAGSSPAGSTKERPANARLSRIWRLSRSLSSGCGGYQTGTAAFASGANCGLRIEPRLILELVDHMAISCKRQAGVMA